MPKWRVFCTFSPSSLLWGGWGIIVSFYSVQDCNLGQNKWEIWAIPPTIMVRLSVPSHLHHCFGGGWGIIVSFYSVQDCSSQNFIFNYMKDGMNFWACSPNLEGIGSTTNIYVFFFVWCYMYLVPKSLSLTGRLEVLTCNLFVSYNVCFFLLSSMSTFTPFLYLISFMYTAFSHICRNLVKPLWR